MKLATPIPTELKEKYDDIEFKKTGITETTKSSEPEIQFAELKTIERLSVTRTFDLLEAIMFNETAKTFVVKSQDETPIYQVSETSKWTGYLLTRLKELRFLDMNGVEAFTLTRSLPWTSNIMPCQLQKACVFKNNVVLGIIEHEWTLVSPKYVIKDEDEQNLFYVIGSYYMCDVFDDLKFRIEKEDGTEVGKICKKWHGLYHYLFKAPFEDTFGVSFEQYLPVEHKVLLFASAFLIGSLYE